MVHVTCNMSQRHSGAGRIISMKNSNDIIGNRTRNLPACIVVTGEYKILKQIFYYWSSLVKACYVIDRRTILKFILGKSLLTKDRAEN
jgi:hypothetical protein